MKTIIENKETVQETNGQISRNSDKNAGRELHERFIQLGRQRIRLTNELLAMLPEINEKKIFKKYAATIEEYCWKYAGLSSGVVQKRLKLEGALEDKPLLKDAIEKHGINKIALIATLAKPETQKYWLDKVENIV